VIFAFGCVGRIVGRVVGKPEVDLFQRRAIGLDQFPIGGSYRGTMPPCKTQVALTRFSVPLIPNTLFSRENPVAHPGNGFAFPYRYRSVLISSPAEQYPPVRPLMNPKGASADASGPRTSGVCGLRRRKCCSLKPALRRTEDHRGGGNDGAGSTTGIRSSIHHV
jgi:hypothetical protein